MTMVGLTSVEETPIPPPSMPSASSPTPLHLSGFLDGDTIQVEGDAGSLQFSIHFSIQKKDIPQSHFNSSNANTSEKNQIIENTSSFSSYVNVTPIISNLQEMEVKDRNRQPDESTADSSTRNRVDIMTRLRSGAISPVKYFPAISCNKLKGIKKKKDMLKTVLRRHSLPYRPCSSYTLFVMANWGSVKHSSFGESSKNLGQMWRQLSGHEKKVYMDMALKDSERYKRQCTLLKRKPRKRKN